MINYNEIDIAQKLIRCKSTYPNDDGALKVVEKECKVMGFKCTKLRFAQKGYNSQYGARPLRRALQRFVENPLSKQILQGEFTNGDSIMINSKKDELTLSKC